MVKECVELGYVELEQIDRSKEKLEMCIRDRYNLTNINITEREKEIATIKVLGFFDKEVSAYVYRESAVLSLIGTLAGLVLGVFLHMFVIYTVEVDAVMFGRSIKPLSYLFAALLTLLFSLLVNLVMHRKLKKISMVESMKAPE